MFSFLISCKSEHKNYHCIDNEICEISETCETTFIQHFFARFRIIFIQFTIHIYIETKKKISITSRIGYFRTHNENVYTIVNDIFDVKKRSRVPVFLG